MRYIETHKGALLGGVEEDFKRRCSGAIEGISN